MIALLLAQIGAQAVISAIMTLIILGLVFWLLWWLVNYIAIPEPFKTVANAVLAIAAVFLLINVLMSLIGFPLVRWQ